MPTGKVKWYDAEKGFGFLSQEDGPDVYVRSDALPDGVTSLKNGTRVEFGIAQGRRGDQALQVRVLDKQPSLARQQSQADTGLALVRQRGFLTGFLGFQVEGMQVNLGGGRGSFDSQRLHPFQLLGGEFPRGGGLTHGRRGGREFGPTTLHFPLQLFETRLLHTDLGA